MMSKETEGKLEAVRNEMNEIKLGLVEQELKSEVKDKQIRGELSVGKAENLIFVEKDKQKETEVTLQKVVKCERCGCVIAEDDFKIEQDYKGSNEWLCEGCYDKLSEAYDEYSEAVEDLRREREGE